MNNYRIEGESRQVGAIGIFEPFVENVARESSYEAYNDVRAKLYSNNREHVHIKAVYLLGDGEYERQLIEPRAYL